MPGDVTKDDVREIFRKLDIQNTTMTAVQIDVAVIKQQMEDAPEIPTQPCTRLKEHLQDHKENKKMFKRPIVSGAVAAVYVFIGTIAEPVWTWLKSKF